jgi:hypothetical protein
MLRVLRAQSRQSSLLSDKLTDSLVQSGEDECDAKVAHKLVQNHHSEQSKTDKDDVDPCVQYTSKHRKDPSKQDQKDQAGPIRIVCEQKNQ